MALDQELRVNARPEDDVGGVVRSRHGVWSALYNLFVVGLGVGMFMMGAQYLLGLRETLWETMLLLGPGALLVYVGLAGLSMRLAIDLEGISLKSIWGAREAKWPDVETVRFRTNYFGAYTVILYLGVPGNRRFQVMVGLARNGHELGKAILEASSVSNPAVRFTGAHHYGPPPYGIFGPAEHPAGTVDG